MWFGDNVAPLALDEYPYDGTAEIDLSVYPALQRFAEPGFGLVACYFDCQSGSGAEMAEQVESFGAQVTPQAKAIRAAGEWKRDY
jgi:hypothetical protein